MQKDGLFERNPGTKEKITDGSGENTPVVGA
jgi:hypothetical protein